MFSLSSLDPLIKSRSLLKHPFYVKWEKGELTLDDLRTYAKEYFHLVERVPGIVARVRVRVQDPLLRVRLELQEQEEFMHVELWKRFARSLGVSARELLTHEPSQKVRAAVKCLEELVAEGLEEGVAALYAFERELPEIARTKKEGLLRFYGLSSEDAHVYFDEHLEEERHLASWRSIPLSHEGAREAAEVSLTAQNQILDAVCERCGISMACAA
jgi:pyrroloquinoline-quinone synthase